MNPYQRLKINEFLIITAIGIVIGFLFCPLCYFSWEGILNNWKNMLLSVIYTYVLGYGCTFISEKYIKKYFYGERPIKGFLISLVILAIYSFCASIVVRYLAIKLLYDPSYRPTILDLVKNAQFPMYIALAISMFFSGIEFLKRWKSEAVKSERLEKEKIATQYESLRNQVNPHFLFNSLNTLASLVYDNQEMAVRYIHQLSEVYRYVLDSRNKDLVPIEEEIQFLESYIFLQKLRFGNNIKIDIDLKNSGEKQYILPLALQILIENAVKHNEVSSEKPLEVKIFENNKNYVIENRISRKHLFEKGLGIGLSNIKDRYQLLSNKTVEVIIDSQTFVVKLPIIKAIP